MLPLLLFAACLVDTELYEERLAELTDDDGDGFNDDDGDCDDADPAVFPEALEACDGLDNDCDGAVDETPPTWFLDADEDGFGDADHALEGCEPPAGYVTDATDCDDLSAAISPSADEICDGVDNDCDELVDLEDPSFTGDVLAWYPDADGDGYGDAKGLVLQACEVPEGHVGSHDDCDDTDDGVHPDATETWYDGTDQDCSGGSDYDRDQDGHDHLDYGGDDCDDDEAGVFPGAFEWADALDTNCDGDAETFRLSSAAAKYAGQASDDKAGEYVFGCGDVNGDGWEDLYVGASAHDGNGTDSGAGYVIFGHDSLADLGLASADVKLEGIVSGDRAGQMTTAPGDLDGDGIDDILVSAIGSDTNGVDSGTAYVVYGAPDLASMDLSGSDITWSGDAAGDQVGLGLAFVGDVDGDGAVDVSVGAFLADDGVATDSGRTYFVFGGGGVPGGDLSDVSDAQIQGEALGDSFGANVVSPGDVDADGLSDVAIWAPGSDVAGAGAGCAYVILGMTLPTLVDVTDADAVLTPGKGDSAGMDPTEIGDLDDDGYADIGARSPRADDSGLDAGATYLFFGSHDVASRAAVDADVTLLGESEDDWAGYSLAPIGDLDGDGHDDIMVGAPYSDRAGLDSGVVYVARGPFAGTLSLGEDADAFIGAEGGGDVLGLAIDGRHDWNGDGVEDLAVGADRADGVGAAYLILSPFGG